MKLGHINAIFPHIVRQSDGCFEVAARQLVAIKIRAPISEIQRKNRMLCADPARHAAALGNLPQIPLGACSILHHRGAADDLELSNFRKIVKNFVLNTIGKVGIVFIRPDILEGKNRDALFSENRIVSRPVKQKCWTIEEEKPSDRDSNTQT